jgi:hypothetical protein
MSGSSEAHALEAIIDNHNDEAIHALDDYTAGELHRLAKQAQRLANLCNNLAEERP